MKPNRAVKNKQEVLLREHVWKAPFYIISGLKFHAAGRIYTPKPLYCTLNMTHRCNSRCVMCRYWRQQSYENELKRDEIGDIFCNPLFDSIEKLVLSGGEPTLREDLVEVTRTILDSLPRVKEVALITNGLDPDLVVERVGELLTIVNSRRHIQFAVSVSLDGYGEVHEKIRRVPRAFERVSETLYRLKELKDRTPFYLCSTSVIQPLNISSLPSLMKFAQEIGLPVSFTPVCVSDFFTDNVTSRNSLKLSDDNLRELNELVNNQLRPYLTLSNIPFWQEYFSLVSGGKRKIPCFLLRHFVLVDSNGLLRMCSASDDLIYGSVKEDSPDKIWYSQKAEDLRKRVSKHLCPTCDIQCDLAFTFTHEIFYYTRFWLKTKMRALIGK